MMTEICQYLRNWFDRKRIFGTFKVVDGMLVGTSLALSDYLQPGQYYRIIGSVLNDGVHKYGDTKDVLTAEREFSGAVWTMAVPKELAELADQIKAWAEKNAAVIDSPYMSESFGGYSYSKGYTSSGGTGNTANVTWMTQYASRLAAWRKI